jgi:hypothetical protein
MAKLNSPRFPKKPQAARTAAKRSISTKILSAAKTPAPPVPQGSKTATCLAMLRQSDGVSLQQLVQATGWQAHSVRGFLSGAVRKKMGLALESVEAPDGIRRYRVTAGE